MSHLAKLTLSETSIKQPISPLARKRLNLIRKLDIQILAAQADLKGGNYQEEITRWVRVEGEEPKKSIKQRPVRKWWWQHHRGCG